MSETESKREEDLIDEAIDKAIEAWGDSEIRNMFNAAAFGIELNRLRGVEGGMDGNLVRIILSQRKDIVALSGGSHFKRVPRYGQDGLTLEGMIRHKARQDWHREVRAAFEGAFQITEGLGGEPFAELTKIVERVFDARVERVEAKAVREFFEKVNGGSSVAERQSHAMQGTIEPPQRLTLSAAIERLQTFVRKQNLGACRIPSQGVRCTCPLCDIERLAEAIRPSNDTLFRDAYCTPGTHELDEKGDCRLCGKRASDVSR